MVRGAAVIVIALVLLAVVGARTLAGGLLDYEWWKEQGQVSTWVSMMLYSVAPGAVAFLIGFVVFWIAHARGMKAGGTRLGAHPLYARLVTLGVAVVAFIFAAQTVDAWTVVRYFGGRGSATTWSDPVFGKPLAFYLFELPFYQDLLRSVLGLCIVGGLIFWVTARGWRLRSELPTITNNIAIQITPESVAEWFHSGFLRLLAAVFLLGIAVWFYLNRYGLLLTDHGFMVGVDWVAENVRLPMVWLSIGACVLAAGMVWLRRLAAALWLVLVPLLGAVVPGFVNSLYVRPNEIAIQKPYIQRHIDATRSAFGLNSRMSEREYAAKADARVDVGKNRALLDNVRLWDWRAFHDTVSQIQPLRPYTFSDTDVDRYMIDGQLRQVLVSPREIDLNQLGDARSRWINPHFVYTHGYGLVMAEANRITSNGLPVLFIRDAPPEILSKSLKLSRPELYYGEEIHEPVFVNTGQPEFNYPSGSENVHTKYEGQGGFPISSLPMRLAASLAYGDWNITLTSQLQANSRMMIHRSVRERLGKLAGFVSWDSDPYLVLGDDGRLFWMLDGYLTTNSHPYSRAVSMRDLGEFNYIRNSVKATIDAYNGTTTLYVFDDQDPLIRAYRNLFPALFHSAGEMPADLRAHARYPESLFRAQAEMYRTYHMRDAEAFYNKADLWDVARSTQSQEGQPQAVAPVYVIASLPGVSAKPEFLLTIPFTPRNKDNLIGLMMARCDGPELGEMYVLLLSKQEILLGPMQVEARINQDQNISKDLTLWNQQGSQVLRGQMIVLPVDGTFVYIEPVYIQAKEARMPQLKKVVVAVGNSLYYTDTYEQALAQLAGAAPPPVESANTTAPATAPQAASTATTPPPANADVRLSTIRGHLKRYRELAAQGKWAEAGRELEAIESLAGR